MMRFQIFNLLVIVLLTVGGCGKDNMSHPDREERDSVISSEDSLSAHDGPNESVYSRGGLKLLFRTKGADFDATLEDHLVQAFFNVYPKIKKRFNKGAPGKVVIVIDSVGKASVQTMDNIISFGASLFEENPENIDELTHQLAYIVFDDSNHMPNWLMEGLANYIRYKYGVQNKEAGWEVPKYNPNKEYRRDSMTTLRFLVWLEDNINTQIIDQLNSVLVKESYSPGIWKEITWRSLDYLWDAYSANPDLSTSEPYEAKIMDQASKRAFAAFNYWFYDTKRNLYYLNTEHSRIASGWTQAVFWNIIMDAYKETKNPQIYSMINELYRGAKEKYSDFRWNDVKYVNGWIYDDMMWWVDAMCRAYRITNDEKYLRDAKNGFDFVWGESYDPVKGGMKWSWKVIGKNACINYPTVIGAMRLYKITGKEEYLSKAKMIYTWARDVFFQESTGRVADHKVGNDPVGYEDYTYNQGTCIGAALLLYKTTGKGAYLEDAKQAANYTMNKMCNRDGILPNEGGEGGVFKSIFINYMSKLIKKGGQQQYLFWLKKNTKTVWGNRDLNRDICFTDYTIPCPGGTVSSYSASSGVNLLLSLSTFKDE